MSWGRGVTGGDHAGVSAPASPSSRCTGWRFSAPASRSYNLVVLCEAAHAAMRAPGPLRAFGARVRARRDSKIATVAVARKLVCLAWQLLTKHEDYHYERPALTFRKLRQLELAAGAPKRSNPGARNSPATPDTAAQWKAEREQALRIEERYRDTIANWQPQRPSAAPT